jgi:hypothetical protein
MKKASKPTVAKKPTAKKPMQKQPSAKLANSKKAQGGAGLTEVVAQLAQSAEKLAQAAKRLAEATARLSITAEARPESAPTQGQPAADLAAPQPEPEAADATDSE